MRVSSGLMAYEIFTGAYPFEFDSIWMLLMKVMNESPDTSKMSGELELWIERLIEHEPNLRYQSAYDALRGLYKAQNLPMPPETQLIRESFLQASDFVGRDAQLKQLTSTLNTLEDVGAFFLIGGESGVGKSRLLDELRIEALVRNALVIRGQGVEGGGLPFQLWRNIVRRMLLVVEVTDLQAGVLKDIVPDIDVLLGRAIAKAPELAGKAYQERMLLTIVDLFRNLPQSVVLLLEDLQWTVESLSVLEQMLKVREQLSQLMIVATYRDDETPGLSQKLARMTQIKLERLTADAVSKLSTAMLGAVGNNAEVVELLHSQSEGNLFFLVETVRALAEASGDLERIGQGELPEGVFTGGMQAITRRHLSKVDAQYSGIQTLAAVIGREIDTKLLEYAYNETTVQAWLSNASEYGVISIRENTWRFAHDKLHEALIADIPDETLRQIHRLASETIEAVYPDDDGYNEALLAHWQQVGDLDKTYLYLRLVVEGMIEISGTYSIAETHIHQMLDRLPEDDPRCTSLWNQLARSKWYRADYDASLQHAQQAKQLATTHDNHEELTLSVYTIGRVAGVRGDYATAAELFQQSLSIQQKLGDQLGIANSLDYLGLVAFYQGHYALAHTLYQRSLSIRQELDNQYGVSRSIMHMGNLAYVQGDYVRAHTLHQQSLAIQQHMGDQSGIAQSLSNLGNVARSQGDFAHASELYQESLSIQKQLGNHRSIGQILNNLGIVECNRGNYSLANELYQQNLAIQQELGNRVSIGIVLHNLGNVARSQGDYARASELYQESLSIQRQLGDQRGIAYNLNNIGIVAAIQGDYAHASELFQQSFGIHQELGDQFGIAESLCEMGWLALQQGHEQESVSHFVNSLKIALEASLPTVTLHINRLMPHIEAALHPDDLQTALERGKSLDLDTVVQELLAEFGDEVSPEE